MTGTLERHFLGWDRAPLAAAAEWLHGREGTDMSGLLVALPGARAGRRLGELLARRVGPAWRPPRILTAGALVDELLVVEGRPAGRLVRTLAWARALREVGERELERLVAHPPEDGDLGGWMRLAERVRSLFGELAAEGLDFAALARGPGRPAVAGEAARWETLAAAQGRMIAALAEADLVDPHLARLAAIEAGRAGGVERVVLVGIVDMNALLRRTVQLVGDRTTILLPAPAHRAPDFDEFGCLRPEAWKDRVVPLPLDAWRVVDRPGDQAAEVMRTMAIWNGRFAPEEISIGVAEPEVVPFLERRLADAGLRARDASGTPLASTAPWRLLEATARFLARRRFVDYAALLRHPDLEAALRATEGNDDLEPAGALDAYHDRHLPEAVDGRWLGGGEERAPMERMHGALLSLLGELAGPARRPLPQWSAALRALLVAVYGAHDIDADDEATRVLAGALAALGTALGEVEETALPLAPDTDAAEAIELLLAGLRAGAVPPRAAAPGEPTLELLGWLELPLDDAPALIVTGFQEGRIPETVLGDAFLPDHLRHELGLLDNERRLARDVFTVELLLASHPALVFVSGRRSTEGDPLRPSRIAFHVPEDEVPNRVRRYLAAGAHPTRPERDEETRRPRTLPRLPRAPTLERWSVTSFGRYLESPYLFYLERVLRLESVDDEARELDAATFGDLAHQTLEAFGTGPARDSVRAAEIEEFLREELRRRARRRYGERPPPAVALQIERLARRLGRFAGHQAERARQGWRIAYCEWKPPGEGIPFDVDGTPVLLRGRIDRIDRHDDGRMAIWDYKSGERVKRPEARHRGKEGWRDLQLPLYTVLAAEILGDALPVLGYATLGREEKDIGFLAVKKPWTREDLDSAVETARAVVRAAREGEFFTLGKGRPYGEVIRAICGIGLVDDEPNDEEEER